MRLLILALLLSGCASVPYVQPPHLERVCVTVEWVNEAELAKACGDVDGCATVGKKNGDETKIWATKPLGFDDTFLVLVLGHELLHNLGATHE